MTYKFVIEVVNGSTIDTGTNNGPRSIVVEENVMNSGLHFTSRHELL